MAHQIPAPSAPGTPIEDRTVGELVAAHPGLSRVFQRHAIDFCCQGARTVRQACAAREVPLEIVAAELRNTLAGPVPQTDNPATLPPPALITHIVEKHHGFLQRELPRLHAMAQRVAQRHGGHTPSLIEVFHVFDTMAVELDLHMQKEEMALFPAIEALFGERASPPLDAPIECMIQEHSDAGDCLARLRELTSGFVPPPEACNTYRALFAGLAELETDLHTHIHLENSVLFPAALRRQAG